MYTLLVAGAGYTGGKIAHYFRSKNQKVITLNRTSERANEFAGAGIQPFTADLLKPETLVKIPPAHFVVISVAPDKRDAEHYRQTYLDGVHNLLQAMSRNPRPILVLYLSSTGVYGSHQHGILDETVDPEPDSEKGKILLEAEQQILGSGYDSVIFRLAGIYGPGRNRIQAVQNQEWDKLLKGRYLNLIHVDDVVESLPRVFKKARVGQVYIGVDDQPVPDDGLLKWLLPRLSLNLPQNIKVPGTAAGKRYNNARFKALGCTLKYPSFREGYESILKLHAQERKVL